MRNEKINNQSTQLFPAVQSQLFNLKELNGKTVVSALELHHFLLVNSRFDIWIKRMFDYGFTETTDYQRLYKNVQALNGTKKQALADYALSLDCAKEISMIQRTEKGKQARQYFIECEKQLKNNYCTTNVVDTIKEMQKTINTQRAFLNEKDALIKSLSEKKIIDKDKSPLITFCVKDIAKELGVSAIELNLFLKFKGIQEKHGEVWLLKDYYKGHGLAVYDEYDGIHNTRMKWTNYGRKFVIALFTKGVDITYKN